MKYLMLVTALFLSGCTIVGPGERAARYTFGKMSEEPLQPGTHLWIPFIAGTSTMNVQVHAIETNTSAGTKDQQEVSTTIVVNLQIDPEKVINVIKMVGSEDGLNARVMPIIQEAINANVSKFSAEEILTKRGELKAAIELLVKERLTPYGVIIHDISLKDLQYSKEYANSIEQKQISEQRSKQAEYEAQRAKVDASAAVNKARGLADAALIQAKAEAESNKLKLQTLTPQLIQYEAVQKWDGSVPTVMGGSSGMMFNLPIGGSKKSE